MKMSVGTTSPGGICSKKNGGGATTHEQTRTRTRARRHVRNTSNEREPRGARDSLATAVGDVSFYFTKNGREGSRERFATGAAVLT